MIVLGAVVGFMGPFGTYLERNLAQRTGSWVYLFLGAYLVVRPTIVLLRKLARVTDLPGEALTFWGVWLCSAPLAAIWRASGQQTLNHLQSYTSLVPFSLLCSIGVLGVTRWAAGADLRLAARAAFAERNAASLAEGRGRPEQPLENSVENPVASPDPESARPALANRLSRRFEGPILALQSEDHYVRVHGARESELVLMRLRDAIGEMDGVPGEQVHRSWWVARHGISRVVSSGRNWTICLTSGQSAPVARDSIARLQRAGFLPPPSE